MITHMNLKEMTAKEYASEQIEHFKEKADHNKIESIWCFRLIMVCSLLSPIFISLGEGFWYSKLVPSLLASVTAFGTAWLQLRKPQELWSIYRTAQRNIEFSLVHYQFQVENYHGQPQEALDKTLISEVTAFSKSAHETWTKKIPDNLNLEKNK